MTRCLVLFDVDGTLVDSQHLIHAAVVETLARIGHDAPDRAFILGGVGLSLDEGMRRLLGEAATDAAVTAAVDAYRDVFHVLRSDPALAEPVFPGALDALAKLGARSDLVLGIATGKSRRGIAHLVERFGWQDVFATIQTADDAPSKPHPGMVLQAARDTGTEPADAIMVGDTSFDMAMARAAGAFAVGVAWGNHPAAMLEEAGAQAIIDAFDELPAAIDRLKQVNA